MSLDLVVALLLLLPFLLFAFLRLRKPSPHLPPGPPPLPLLGNLHHLGLLPYVTFHHLSKKYGPLIRIHFGKISSIIVCDADAACEVLKTQDSVFCSRTQITSLRHFTYGGNDLAFCPYNDHWKHLRRLCNAEVFNLRRVQSFHPLRREEVDALVNTVSKTATRGEPVNISEMVFCYINNLIFREVFGGRVSADGECGSSPLRVLLREIVAAMGELGAGDLFPLMGWVDEVSGWRAKIEKVFAKMDLLFEEKIREHGEGDVGQDYFLDALLKLKDGEEDASLTMNEIKGVLMNMFTAGTDTSATVIEWGMTQLMKHPEELSKAQEEVRRVVGDKGRVEESDLQDLHYLKLIIKETLRLHPPAPMLPPRETMKDTKLNGYDIPAKTTIYVNVWSVGRDPKYWDDPDDFRPERFMNKSISFKGGSFELIPFGSGRRICPGLTLAMANVELAFSNLLYGFNWEFPTGMNKNNIDMRPVPGLICPRKVPLILVATPTLIK